MRSLGLGVYKTMLCSLGLGANKSMRASLGLGANKSMHASLGIGVNKTMHASSGLGVNKAIFACSPETAHRLNTCSSTPKLKFLFKGVGHNQNCKLFLEHSNSFLNHLRAYTGAWR